MKNIFGLLLMVILSSCSEKTAEKPDNLIKEEKMVEVLYDLSVLEALKSQRSLELTLNGVDAATYIYKKHQIDSVQLAQSNKYYAADLDNYKKLYDKVKKKIEAKKLELGPSPQPANQQDDTPRVE